MNINQSDLLSTLASLEQDPGGTQLMQEEQQSTSKGLPDPSSDEYKRVMEMARLMHEQETKEYERKKRSREEREDQQRELRRKVEDLRATVLQQIANRENRTQGLYMLFNDLQCMAVEAQLDLEAPEIVVVGMQSDGKSTFVEALLGFQFNVVDTNIGTRRPLIIQMINDSTRQTPHCIFRREDSSEMELNDTPVSQLSDEIVRRTNNAAGENKDQVSPKPILLRVEYAKCANLTIYDTPGFRLGGNEVLRRAIQSMVEGLMAPKHRLLVCLEQSTVEWSNTVSRPIVQRVDPTFSRTILVNTKFDNRTKELRTQQDAVKYLAAEGDAAKATKFFISLPVQRHMSPARFNESIVEAYVRDMECLLEVGVDDESVLQEVGFFGLRQYLEDELTARYQQAMGPTLHKLEDSVSMLSKQANVLQSEIAVQNPEHLAAKAQQFAWAVSTVAVRLLNGSAIGNPDVHGQTLKEEHSQVTNDAATWNGVTDTLGEFPVDLQEFKLYGGSQYRRLLNEFTFVAHSVEFPQTSENEVAAALGVHRSHTLSSRAEAASDLVRIKVRRSLQPLIDVLLERCSHIINHLLEVAMAVAMDDDASIAILSAYPNIGDELRRRYAAVTEKLLSECRLKLTEDFASLTDVIDWNLRPPPLEAFQYDATSVTAESTKLRVLALMSANRPDIVQNDPSQQGYEALLQQCAQLFAGIRFYFVRNVNNKLHTCFLKPFYDSLAAEIPRVFHQLDQQTYSALFNTSGDVLQKQLAQVQLRLSQSTKIYTNFKDAVQNLKSSRTQEQ